MRCSRGSTPCSSAAGCASRSSRRRATASASRCWRPTRSAPAAPCWSPARSCCPRTWWWPTRSPPCSGAPRPSSGTGRWACSRWPRSPRAPAAWRRRSSTHPRSRWSAAAIPRPPCGRSASPKTGSRTSRRAAARRWSSWRAKTFRASRFWSPDVGRKPLIAGNWKMNLTHLEAIALMQKFAFALREKYYDKVEVAVLPPFTHIRSIQTMIDGDGLLMVHGAQDLSPFDSGAYTGDVSGVMLAKLGCRYVVVGHSERREYHGETDEVVNGKVRAAIRNGITPILCVGEGLSVREQGEHLGHCTSQLTGALAKVTAEQAADLVV